ncbi:hypothetical protein HAX54_031363, partial [Datura stramonium]|nr:hypothetical protein [Datura stramonium]
RGETNATRRITTSGEDHLSRDADQLLEGQSPIEKEALADANNSVVEAAAAKAVAVFLEGRVKSLHSTIKALYKKKRKNKALREVKSLRDDYIRADSSLVEKDIELIQEAVMATTCPLWI